MGQDQPKAAKEEQKSKRLASDGELSKSAEPLSSDTPSDSRSEVIDSADVHSDPFIGRWNRLVSTTNWEKGRIIHEWRASLIAVNAPVTEYSDESWSRIIGGSVSGQHAGRLRRVYERFGDVYEQYDGLYWSHFQSALDWDDAEMWLEGSIQNKWSVAVMRRRRWETMGAVKDDEPKDKDVVVAETDEDSGVDGTKQATGEESNESASQTLIADDNYVAEARSPAGPDFGDEDDVDRSTQGHDAVREEKDKPSTPADRPFADIPSLPEDLAAAFEAFQLAILQHKATEWADVARDDVLRSLDALKALAVAAAE